MIFIVVAAAVAEVVVFVVVVDVVVVLASLADVFDLFLYGYSLNCSFFLYIDQSLIPIKAAGKKL